MALRSFAYDNPNYTVVRQHCSIPVPTATSAVAFAQFRSRVKVVVNAITAICYSAASVAKVVFIAARAGSTNTTFTIASCTSAGAMTVVSCAITLLSAGDLLSISIDESSGGYQILYEYNVVPYDTTNGATSLYSNQ